MTSVMADRIPPAYVEREGHRSSHDANGNEDYGYAELDNNSSPGFEYDTGSYYDGRDRDEMSLQEGMVSISQSQEKATVAEEAGAYTSMTNYSLRDDEAGSIPLVGPGAPFWPDRNDNDDPLVQLMMMRGKYRATVSTQTTMRELIRVEDLELQLDAMKDELSEALQALTDTRVALEVEHKKTLDNEIEIARKTAVDRNKFLQEKYEDKVEQLRLVERSKISNIEGKLRQEKEDAVRDAVQDAERKHAEEKMALESALKSEKEARMRATYELERLKKNEASTSNSKDGIGITDLVKIEYDQKKRIEEAEKREEELNVEINKLTTDLRHAKGEIVFKSKRIVELEEKVKNEMSKLLKEREDFESAQRKVREDLGEKLIRLEMELKSTRRHLDHVRGDYRREREISEIISARQLEVLGQLKRHNIELSEKIAKLERRLNAAKQFAENNVGSRNFGAAMAIGAEEAVNAPPAYNKTDQEDEEWSKLRVKSERRRENDIITVGYDENGELIQGFTRKNLNPAAPADEAVITSLSLPHVHSNAHRFASSVSKAKKDLVPGSANILKVKDACQGMQAITGIISDYQKYLVDLTSSIDENSTADKRIKENTRTKTKTKTSVSISIPPPLPKKITKPHQIVDDLQIGSRLIVQPTKLASTAPLEDQQTSSLSNSFDQNKVFMNSDVSIGHDSIASDNSGGLTLPHRKPKPSKYRRYGR